MTRKLLAAAAAAALLALNVAPVATTAYAQDGFRADQQIYQLQERRPAIRPDIVAPRYTLEPRFIVEAVRLHAYNETGWDRLGSDEIYLEYEDRVTNTSIVTGVFGNFDTGDTRTVPGGQSCIAPVGATTVGAEGWPVSWSCNSAGAPRISFRIHVRESDDWDPRACGGRPGAPPRPGRCTDDRVGVVSHSLTAGALAGLMPNVGDTHTRTSDANGYRVTYRIRRVADFRRPMVNASR
ncbi:MAG: hypothetical protein AB7J28_04230 [Hyphomonadaceae bacterium]